MKEGSGELNKLLYKGKSASPNITKGEEKEEIFKGGWGWERKEDGEKKKALHQERGKAQVICTRQLSKNFKVVGEGILWEKGEKRGKKKPSYDVRGSIF